MRKFLSRFVSMLAAVALSVSMQSCSDDDDSQMLPDLSEPSVVVEVKDVQRTQADFVIFSSGASDYAYMVVDAESPVSPTAEEIFAKGVTGHLDGGFANVSTIEVEGGKTFDVYVATRRINPYVYSEVKKVSLNTDIEYTDIVTLDRIGITGFRYHIKYPEGATDVRHLVVKKTDYEAVKSILAIYGEVTYELYLKVFGYKVEGTTDVDVEKYHIFGKTPGTNDLHVHSEVPLLLMVGEFDESGQPISDKFKCIEFSTRPAGACPYDIQCSVETTSTTANVHITPDEGITDYRVYIDKRTEIDYWRREGEPQLRSVVIGHWDDETNTVKRSFTGDVEISRTGLVPETDYVVGIVGFDSEGHERVKYIDFRTGEPTGPRPEITITEVPDQVTAPWKAAAYQVKVRNAREIHYGYFIKSQVDEVLANGTSLSKIIEANGTFARENELAGMLSADGALLENSALASNTTYLFGVWAINEEYVSNYSYVTFTTDPKPQFGGEVRNNMPGHYIASTTDDTGATVTFPVTIATGADDATSAEYAELNRLVALGFGPADQFPYKSPADLIAAGKSAQEAATQYGPHWFIEFREDGIVVPNMQVNSALGWSMGNFGTDKNSYMWGLGVRPNGNLFDNCYDFPVEVSADGNTITVKGYYNANVSVTAYPSMVTASSAWFYSDIQFRCCSNLVLTRNNANSAYLHRGPLSVPRTVVIRTSDTSVKTGRANMAERFTK